jgi:hypothetical protein
MLKPTESASKHESKSARNGLAARKRASSDATICLREGTECICARRFPLRKQGGALALGASVAAKDALALELASGVVWDATRIEPGDDHVQHAPVCGPGPDAWLSAVGCLREDGLEGARRDEALAPAV